MFVTETEYPALAWKANTQEVLSEGVVLHPPLPPIAFETPLPLAVILDPRVSCVVMVMLVLTVVALFVTGAHALLVLNPVVFQPANTPLNVPDGKIVIVRLVLPTPTEFEAEMVTAVVPAVDGVPEMRPVAVSTKRFAGKPLAP
jgi:hypothetical protein